MGHAASILKDDTPVFTINPENEMLAEMGVLGSMELLDVMGDDLSIVNAARVSYNSESNEFQEKDKKLIKFLAKHKHWTPFEQNSLKFRVTCPIYIARQWMKHRCWVFNEISARYTKFESSVYTPSEFRKQAVKNKQASEAADEDLDQKAATKAYDKACKTAIESYNKLLELGVCREQARGVLPVGSHTSFITTVNLRNYMHWYNLRAPKDAQWEIQQYAHASIELVRKKFPIAVECFEEINAEAKSKDDKLKAFMEAAKNN